MRCLGVATTRNCEEVGRLAPRVFIYGGGFHAPPVDTVGVAKEEADGPWDGRRSTP